jgi:hypothetical protein
VETEPSARFGRCFGRLVKSHCKMPICLASKGLVRLNSSTQLRTWVMVFCISDVRSCSRVGRRASEFEPLGGTKMRWNSIRFRSSAGNSNPYALVSFGVWGVSNQTGRIFKTRCTASSNRIVQICASVSLRSCFRIRTSVHTPIAKMAISKISEITAIILPAILTHPAGRFSWRNRARQTSINSPG